MAITIFLRYFSCGLILYCIDAKSISLNDLIAADKLDLHPHQEIPNIPEQLPPPKVLPLLEVPTPTKAKKRGESSNTINSGKNRSLLKFRKTFPIISPLKPKKLKYLPKPDYKRKNLTTKREVQRRHVKINQKYIPLLRNIELLFDNILSSDSSETYESRKDKYKRNQIADKKDSTCICSGKYDSQESYAQDEGTTSTSSPSNEVENSSSAVTTTAQTDNIIYDNISRFRRNKNIPILFARNPSSFRGNSTRLSEGSSSTYNRGSEGHFPGNNGNSKGNAVIGVEASSSENDVKNSNSNSRNNASGFRFSSGTRGMGTNTQTAEANRGAIGSTTLKHPSNETSEADTRNISEHKEQIEFQVRGIETKSPVFLPELTSGLRDSQEENISIRSTEDYEKSIPSNISNDKRIIVRNGEIATENKKVRRTNEAVGPKVVMIFDGYSVARDVNGENKMTEKAIHIHS